MRLNNLGVAIVAFVVGAGVGAGAVTVPTHSGAQTPPKARAVEGRVQFFPRSSDSPAPPFYKVGDHLICRDIILDSGEHLLGDHPYLASYIEAESEKLSSRTFAPMCTLSNYHE